MGLMWLDDGGFRFAGRPRHPLLCEAACHMEFSDSVRAFLPAVSALRLIQEFRSYLNIF